MNEFSNEIGNNQTNIEKENLYQQIIENSLETIIIHADHKVLYINESGAKFLRAVKDDIIGESVLGIVQDKYKEAIKQRIRKVMDENKPAELIEQTMIRLDGTLVDVEVNCNPILYGNKRAIQSVLRDITKRKEAEKSRKKLLREINEISAPIVPIIDGISVLPLVGSIDSDRARQLLADIPSKVQKKNVHCLIIDFSGIYNFDTMVADYLLKMSATMKLLGIRPILTGLGPEFAQIAVELGVDLSSIQTVASVKHAIQSLGVRY